MRNINEIAINEYDIRKGFMSSSDCISVIFQNEIVRPIRIFFLRVWKWKHFVTYRTN